MHIRKFKSFYRINLRETEMSLLQQIVQAGMTTIVEEYEEGASGLSPAEKRILNEILDGKRDWVGM